MKQELFKCVDSYNLKFVFTVRLDGQTQVHQILKYSQSWNVKTQCFGLESMMNEWLIKSDYDLLRADILFSYLPCIPGYLIYER